MSHRVKKAINTIEVVEKPVNEKPKMLGQEDIQKGGQQSPGPAVKTVEEKKAPEAQPSYVIIQINPDGSFKVEPKGVSLLAVPTILKVVAKTLEKQILEASG